MKLTADELARAAAIFAGGQAPGPPPLPPSFAADATPGAAELLAHRRDRLMSRR